MLEVQWWKRRQPDLFIEGCTSVYEVVFDSLKEEIVR